MRAPDREYYLGDGCIRLEWWDEGFRHATVEHTMSCRGRHTLQELDTTTALGSTGLPAGEKALTR